jgi:protein-tyrosine-phosphatase
MGPKRVLFLSHYNAARSVMAEAALRQLRPAVYEVHSAGLEPGKIDARALTALEHQGIDTRDLHSKPFSDYQGQQFDYIIALCDKYHTERDSFTDTGQPIMWDFQDPGLLGNTPAFGKCLAEIQQRIQMFLLVTEKQPRKR